LVKDDRVFTARSPIRTGFVADPTERRAKRVLVACPDSRQPAYEAVAGLAAAGRLECFVTGYYSGRSGLASSLPPILPERMGDAFRRRLARRRHDAIPDERVVSVPEYDAAIAVENRTRGGRTRRRIAQWRTRRFDRVLANEIKRRRPELVLVFSDVGSEFALPLCRRMGIPGILSVVHGDPEEELALLDAEVERSPDYFPLYLGDGGIDRAMLGWLHDRRAADARLATLILVPSEHIAMRLAGRGVARDRINVVPYAADTRRFVPKGTRDSSAHCRFLFSGGICQRKGIRYLFEAWARVARPGWSLRLVGALPGQLGPLGADLGLPGVECVGRVGHAQMPDQYAQADVFVFPSLFEGSAVVTYEAMACGLPSIVTSESGALARDGIEGLIVPAADSEALAIAMRRLGDDPARRRQMGLHARARAETFDWSRYHRSLEEAVDSAWESRAGSA
jgi:glycosyltransferase involved in cell wall biosynthesis